MTAPHAILQLLPRLDSGGVERGTIEIAQAIAKAGIVPLVASSGGMLEPKLTRFGARHLTLDMASKNPLTIYLNARRLLRIIRTQNVRIVHARSRAPAWSGYLAARWAGVPFLTTFHGVYGLESRLKRRYNAVMTKGERVIAVSQFVVDHLRAEYDVPPERIRLIPRGVDFSTFDARKVAAERVVNLIRAWRLPDDPVPILFCPGRITRIKGQHLLIEALALIKDAHFLCIIAGNDAGHEHYREELEDLIRDLGLVGKVRITDNTPYMTEAYTLSHLVVVPSIKPESFGRVAIEAQAMGRIVIATDHGGARETIIPNETGYLVPPQNPEAMAEAIRFALALDEETRGAMGSFAHQHVLSHFSTARMQEATLAVYHELLSGESDEAAPIAPSDASVTPSDTSDPSGDEMPHARLAG